MDVEKLGITITLEGESAATRGLNNVAAAGQKAEASTKTLTASQRALAAQGVSLDQVLAAVNGETKVTAQVNQAAAQATIRTSQSFNNVATAAKSAHGSLGNLKQELVTVTRNVLNLNPAVAQVGSLLGGMALGAGPMIAVLGGIAALGLAYEKLTEKTREAAKEHERLRKVLADLAKEQRQGPLGDVGQGTNEAQLKLAQLRAELAEKQTQRAKLEEARGGPLTGFAKRGSDAVEASLKAQIKAQEELTSAGQKRVIQMVQEADLSEAIQRKELARQTALQQLREDDAFGRDKINAAFDLQIKLLENAVRLEGIQRAQADASAKSLNALALESARLAEAQRLVATMTEKANTAIAKGQSFGIPGVSTTGDNGRGRAVQSTTDIILGFGRVGGKAVESFDESWKRVVADANKVTQEIEKQAQGIRTAVTAATDLAQTFGIISKSVAQAVNGVGQIVAGAGPLKDAIGRAQSNTGSFGAVLSAAGPVASGVVSVIGAFNAAADAQREAARQLREAAAALNMSVENYAASTKTGLSGTLARLQADYAGIVRQIDLLAQQPGANSSAISGYRASAAGTNQILVQRAIDDFWRDIEESLNRLDGPAGEYKNQVSAIQRAYEEQVEGAKDLIATQEQLAKIEELRTRQLANLINELEKAASSTALSRLFSITGGSNLNIGGQTRFLGDSQNAGWFDKFDEYLKLLESSKQAAEDTARWQQLETQFAEQQLQATQNLLSAQENVVNNTRQTYEALKRYSDSLRLSSLSPLTPVQRLTEARNQYNVIRSLAASGDKSALASLPDTANRFLEESKNVNASGARYQQDFVSVRTFVDDITAQYGEQLTTQEKILKELELQTSVAKAALAVQATSTVQQLVDAANRGGGSAAEIERIIKLLRPLGYTLNRESFDLGNGTSNLGSTYTPVVYTPPSNSGSAAFDADWVWDNISGNWVPPGAATNSAQLSILQQILTAIELNGQKAGV